MDGGVHSRVRYILLLCVDVSGMVSSPAAFSLVWPGLSSTPKAALFFLLLLRHNPYLTPSISNQRHRYLNRGQLQRYNDVQRRRW